MMWSPAADEAFCLLKGRSPPPTIYFVVEVDNSEVGMEDVLSQQQGNPQKLYPCAYYSKKLPSANRNYNVSDRELLAMKLALEEWRHWLEGSKDQFIILTNNWNLENIQTARRLNPRQASWALFFTRFYFMLIYCPV